MSDRTHRPAIRRLATARAISIAGGEAAYVSLVFLTLARTHSAGWVAAVLLAWIGVGGLVSPIAGSLGDRFDRRRVMIVSDLAGAACFAAIAFVDRPVLLVVLAALAAVCEAPFFPASSAAIPNLAPSHDLAWANGTIGAGRTVGGLVGPVGGGFLIAAAGPGVAFAVNAATFVVSAAIVATVRGSFSGDRHETTTGLLAGFRHVAATPFLRWLAIAWSIFLVGVGLVLVAEPALAATLGSGSIGFGLLVAGWSAGGLVGALLAPRVVARHGLVPSLVWGAAGAALAIGATAGAPWLATAALMMALAGLSNSVSSVAEETLVQRWTPDAIRSRVFAALEAAIVAALGLGLAVGGVVLAAGPRVAYAVAGVLGLVGCGILLAAVRRIPVMRE
jgi:MFS family permease